MGWEGGQNEGVTLTSSGRQLSAGGGRHTKPRSADQDQEKEEIREEKEDRGWRRRRRRKVPKGLIET